MTEHDGEPTFHEAVANLEESVQGLVSAVCAAGVSVSDIDKAMKAFQSPYVFSDEKPLVITAPDGIPLSDTEYAGFGSGAWSMETGKPLDLRGIV